MTATSPPLTAVVGIAMRYMLTRPSSLLPALALLLPTLALQLAVPSYLRTRLAPAMWTVGVGSVVLIWLSQIATPAVCALVDARRRGTKLLPPAKLARLSLAIGTSVTVGLALAVLPGLWVQARYAFAPLLASRGPDESTLSMLRRSAAETPIASLMIAAVLALAGSALGQGAVAALAEWVGTVTSVQQTSGRHDLRTALRPTCTHVVHGLRVQRGGPDGLCRSCERAVRQRSWRARVDLVRARSRVHENSDREHPRGGGCGGNSPRACRGHLQGATASRLTPNVHGPQPKREIVPCERRRDESPGDATLECLAFRSADPGVERGVVGLRRPGPGG